MGGRSGARLECGVIVKQDIAIGQAINHVAAKMIGPLLRE